MSVSIETNLTEILLRLERKFDNLEEKFDHKIEQLDQKIDNLEKKFDQKFDNLEEKFEKKIDKIQVDLNTLTVGQQELKTKLYPLDTKPIILDL